MENVYFVLNFCMEKNVINVVYIIVLMVSVIEIWGIVEDVILDLMD